VQQLEEDVQSLLATTQKKLTQAEDRIALLEANATSLRFLFDIAISTFVA